MNRFGRKALQPLGVKLQPIDDLVDHLALGPHGKAHQIEIGADRGFHHLPVGGVMRGLEHVLGIDRRLDLSRQRPLEREVSAARSAP